MLKQIQKSLITKLIWLTFFSIWMAYLESAVVIYLREIYYPEGFNFPITIIPNNIALIEIGRELATIFMLLSISIIAGRGFWKRMSYFMICFGTWDIWYYIWLKVFLGWPASLFTWDLLFLIPVPWSSPVLAPVIVSLSLIFAAVIILNIESKGVKFKLTKSERIILIAAPLIIFISFIMETPKIINAQIPNTYHWELLIAGVALGLFVLFKAVKRINIQK